MASSRTYKASLLGLGQFLTGLAGLLIAAILSRLLPTDEYGSYRQVFVVYGTISSLLSLGLPQALYYFVPQRHSETRSILSSNLSVLVILGGAFTIYLLAGGSHTIALAFNNPKISHLLVIFAPYTLFAIPLLAVNPYLVSINRVQLLVPFNVGSRLIFLAGVVLFVLLVRGVEYAIFGAVISMFVSFVAGMFIIYNVNKQGSWRPRLSHIFEQLQYSMPLAASAIVGVLSHNIDKILVSYYFSPTDFAIYANGAFELPMIAVIVGSVETVLLPEFSSYLKQADYGRVLSIWHRAMVKCALILLPITVYSWVMAPHVIKLLFSSKYLDSTDMFRIYLLSTPFRITQWFTIPMAAGQGKFVFWANLMSCSVSIPLGIYLVQVFGPKGASIGVVVSYVLTGVISILWIMRYMKKSISDILPWYELTKILFISLLASAVFTVVPFMPPNDYLLITIMAIIYFSVVVLTYHKKGYIDLKTMASKYF